jgi:hypothetical protein
MLIFSTVNKELHYILYVLLNNYEKDIIKLIIQYKKDFENNDNINWYIQLGIDMNKLRCDSLNFNKKNLRAILFDPYNNKLTIPFSTIYSKIFKLRIIFNTLKYDDFFLIKYNNKYIKATIDSKIKIINHLLNNGGIEEIKLRLFVYKTSILNDREGNTCFRPIIIKDINNLTYEYNTIAIINNEYKDPVERLPSLIN